MKSEIFEIGFNSGMNAILSGKKEENGVTIYDYKLSWTKENALQDDEFTFKTYTPLVGIM